MRLYAICMRVVYAIAEGLTLCTSLSFSINFQFNIANHSLSSQEILGKGESIWGSGLCNRPYSFIKILIFINKNEIKSVSVCTCLVIITFNGNVVWITWALGVGVKICSRSPPLTVKFEYFLNLF